MVEKSKNNPVGISIHSLDLYQIFSCLINDLSSSTWSCIAVDVGSMTKGLNTYEKNGHNCHLKIR